MGYANGLLAERATAWLRARLSGEDSTFLQAAFQFGSSLDPAAHPNDIDVVLVAVDGAGQPGWRTALGAAGVLKAAFATVFEVPLSVMVLTPSEWNELDGVVVRERRELLKLKTQPSDRHPGLDPHDGGNLTAR